MTIREVAGILAAAEVATTTMSSEDSTRTTGTMMDGTATAALGTTEAAPTTTEAGSSSSRSSPEDAQTGATQVEEVNNGSTDSRFINPIPSHSSSATNACLMHSRSSEHSPTLQCCRGRRAFLHGRLKAAHMMHRELAREREGSSGGQNTE